MLRHLAAALLLAAALPLSPLPATAQERPSFDCARARSEVEKAICASRELSALDRGIATAFSAARAGLDPDSARALREEQDTFNATREIALHSRDTSLAGFMRDHLAMLRRIDPAPAGAGTAAYLGDWASGAGTVKIRQGEEGALAIEIATAAAITGRWVCELTGQAKLADGKLTFTEDDVVVTLARRGGSLEITEKLKEGQMRDYCGANGAVEGRYFRMQAAR
jgi:uncharacterized protein